MMIWKKGSKISALKVINQLLVWRRRKEVKEKVVEKTNPEILDIPRKVWEELGIPPPW